MLDELAGPDAAAALDRIRPVAWLAELDGWLVAGHAAAVEVMRDANTFTVDDPRFSTARVVGASMLSTDGDEHRRHRRPFAAPFRPADVERRYADTVAAHADALLARIAARGSADLRTEFAGPLSVVVVAHALGLDDVDVSTVLAWYGAIVAAVTAISRGDEPAPDAAAAVADLGAAVRRGLQSADSVLSLARGRLDDAAIEANAAVMMFGGIETAEGMIANAVTHVLGEAGLFARLRANSGLVGPAVEESLRLEPAAAVVDRYATRDVELAGAAIARGDLVRVSIAGANRDPDVFADPHRFDLDRPNLRDHVAFARGPHTCLAVDLARLETRIALSRAIESLPGLRLTAPAAATGLVFRKPAELRVEWDGLPRQGEPTGRCN